MRRRDGLRWRSDPGMASATTAPASALGTAIAFLVPFAAYFFTLAPTVYNLDSAELSTAAFTGGIVRSTGYPLYLLVGRAWSRLPIGDVGYRMNLLSAVCGGLTIALAYRLSRRLGIGLWAAAGALGLLASCRYFWAMSLIAEVYTLQTALVAAIALALLAYRDDPCPRRLGAATFMVGLACSHHLSTVLLAPGCLWFVLRVAGRRACSPRSLAAAALGISLGLSVYLYLPVLYLRHPSYNYAGAYDAAGSFRPVDLTTVEGLWWLVSGRVFADRMLSSPAGELPAQFLHSGLELGRAFAGIGLGPGLIGLYLALRRDPPLGGGLLLMFALTMAFYSTYDVVDKDTMFLPAFLVFGLWVGLGYQWLESMVGAREGGRSPTPALVALRAVFLGAVALAALRTAPLVDLSHDWSARQRGEQVLRALEPDALLLGWWSTVPVVQYLQLVEGRRPDVDAVNRFLIDGPTAQSLVRHATGRRPVYFDEPPGALLPELEAVPAGPVFRLRGRTPTRVPPALPERRP